MSSLSNKDIVMWLKNTELPRLGTAYRRTEKPEKRQHSIVIECTVLKTEQPRQSANVIENRTDGTKIFPGGTRPRIFADGTRPKIFIAGETRLRGFADGTRPRGFTDGIRPWIFTDGTGMKSFTDGTRPKIFTDGFGTRRLADGTRPKIVIADGTRPRTFTDKTELKDVAVDYTAVAGTEPKTAGGQQNVDGTIGNVEGCFKILRPVGNEKFRQRSLVTIGQGQSNAEFYGRVENRSEHMRRRFSRQATQKFKPNYLHVPNLWSFASKSETDELMEFIIMDRKLISNIVKEDMDGIVFDWLQLQGLDKFYWFFKQLSFNEIKHISKNNFYSFLDVMENKQRIEKQEVARICQVTKNLRQRPMKLRYLITVLDMKVNINELSEYVDYLKYILPYPVPNKNCTTTQENGKPQFEIYLIMQKIFKCLMECLEETSFLHGNSLLVSVIYNFTKCVKLIHKNQLFFEYQINGVIKLPEEIWHKIETIKKDFN